VKRSLAWFAGLVGIAALGKWLAGRTHRGRQAPEPIAAAPAPPAPATEADGDDDPAAELRAKLAASRDEPRAAVTADETLDDRRSRVHAQARDLIETMEDGAS
jgi:hypothetical protein